MKRTVLILALIGIGLILSILFLLNEYFETLKIPFPNGIEQILEK